MIYLAPINLVTELNDDPTECPMDSIQNAPGFAGGTDGFTGDSPGCHRDSTLDMPGGL